MVHVMNLAWPLILATLVWRSVSKGVEVQRLIHALGSPLTAVLQWYTGFLLTMALVLVWTLFDIFWKYRVVSNDDKLSNLHSIWASNQSGVVNTTGPNMPNATALGGFLEEEAFMSSLEVELWVLRLNLLSQLACVPTFLLSLDHARKVVLSGVALAKLQPQSMELPWFPSQIVNTMLFVIIMPTAFSVMALRSSARIWSLTTGMVPDSEDLSWTELQDREMGKYRGDMELAMVFQFFTIFSFSRLMGSYLTESRLWSEMVGDSEDLRTRAEEYQRTIYFPAFLGVYSFCIFGIFRSVLNFSVAWSQGYRRELENKFQEIQIMLVDKVDTVFLLVTVLCVLNMFFICRMKDVTERLGNANLKFAGTRLLITVAHIQLQVIKAFDQNSDMYRIVEEKQLKEIASDFLHESLGLRADIKRWKLTLCGGHLLHVSLLGLECAAIVVFNRVVWGADVAELDPVTGGSGAAQAGYRPVLAPRDELGGDLDSARGVEHARPPRPPAGGPLQGLLAACLGAAPGQTAAAFRYSPLSPGSSKQHRTPAEYAQAATIQVESARLVEA